MAVLVTGGSGFVGLNVVEELIGRGREAIAFGLAPPPGSAIAWLSGLPGTLSVVEGDVTDRAALEGVFRAHAVDGVIHAAAITSAGNRDREHAREVVVVNLLGTVEVLEAARRHRVGRVLYVSSSSVYGRAAFDTDELDEATTVPVPETLYGITKYAAERTALYDRTLWGTDVVAARLTAVFGRWEYGTGVRDTLSPPLQVARLAVRGEAAILPREGLRDWTYATDVAAALIALMDLKRPQHDVYNVSSGTRWTIESWCRKLEDAFPRFSHRIAEDEGEANIDFHGARDRAPLSNARLVKDTGFRARFGLDEAADDYMEWMGHHRMWRD